MFGSEKIKEKEQYFPGNIEKNVAISFEKIKVC